MRTILEAMDIETACRLNKATEEFYAANAVSFSSTRERPWKGWRRVLAHAEGCIDRLDAPTPPHGCRERSAPDGKVDSPFRVLDVGCGNMRFERMLGDAFPERRIEVYASDSCPTLAGTGNVGAPCRVHYQSLDVVGCLEKGTLSDRLDAPSCDLAVAFGFMHHVPLPAWRRALLEALVAHTAPGGVIALTFWRFAEDAKARKKGARTTAAGCAALGIDVEPSSGDYLLGWQNSLQHFRYCHSFSEAEVDSLVDEARRLGCRLVDSYLADGPDDMSNHYIVLKA